MRSQEKTSDTLGNKLANIRNHRSSQISQYANHSGPNAALFRFEIAHYWL